MSILRLSKVVLAILSQLCLKDSSESLAPPPLQHPEGFFTNSDHFIRSVALQLSHRARNESGGDSNDVFFGRKPDQEVVRSVIRFAWASCKVDYDLLLSKPWEELDSLQFATDSSFLQENEYSEDMMLCKYVLVSMLL